MVFATSKLFINIVRLPVNDFMRAWLAVWVIVVGVLCYASLNSSLFQTLVAISLVSSAVLVVVAIRAGGGVIKRYSLITGLLVFVLTVLIYILKITST